MGKLKRYVVVSSNNNADYLFYLPYVEKAWAKYGWDLCVMVTDDVDVHSLKVNRKETIIVKLPKIEGLRDATISQAGRLYAANYLPMDALIMTSDMDLIPLSDYWHPDIKDITVYGHDLTDYTYFPMGYTAMSGAMWFHYVSCTFDTAKDMLRDCTVTNQAFSEDWEQWWNTDWQILTDKLRGVDVKHIKRGRRLTGTYAYGRVDRGTSMSIPPNETLIDAHCENQNVMHPVKLEPFLKLFESIHGKL
jgi:hypothetical protein